ncbi:S8 family peptidase [Wenzhouxiangella sp. AB-CW3]|uniref:S8 family peptidase n=1 Tax=Wenzhouxiangella sp. AB-CW3 TaxID=2771012 RepID=UPI00168ACE58|nr:S8 family peptidase [Wenzhouxiangella sp. AB-CW3]QOC23889.1 S8 family peptidase [Wenzhouxiangella sp. AB-CW3]
MNKSTSVLLLVVFAVVLAGGASSGMPTTPDGMPEIRGLDSSKRISDQFIVVLEWDDFVASQEVQEMARNVGGEILHRYQYALNGFAIRAPERAAQKLLSNPRVAFIEADQVVSIDQSVQTPTTSGLDRIDQRSLPLDNQYRYYSDGSGVDIYILDTGIRSTHQDIAGRVVSAFTTFNDGLGTEDCNGHGTHVAGTAGGTTYGVAKNATLHSVRVLDCDGDGSLSDVLAGVDFVTSDHSGRAVANMSLGLSTNSSLDNAVNDSVFSGVFYAVSAGNTNQSACNRSPARAQHSYAVGASAVNDVRASFSNWGSCVDIFAPGVNIASAWHTGNTAVNSISGTSMAAPHVAGVAALYLEEDPTLMPFEVAELLDLNATKGKLTGIRSGSPNHLLYSLNPPHVSLDCFYIGRGRSQCDATVLGGIGQYSFDWDASYSYFLLNNDTTLILNAACGWAMVEVIDSKGYESVATGEISC